MPPLPMSDRGIHQMVRKALQLTTEQRAVIEQKDAQIASQQQMVAQMAQTVQKYETMFATMLKVEPHVDVVAVSSAMRAEMRVF